MLEKIDGVYSCIFTADPHGDPFIIDCVRDNGLWWITEQQFLDIVERNGLSVEEFERREIEQSAWVAELSRKRGKFSDRRGTDELIDDQIFMNRMTEYILMETDRWGKAGERNDLRVLQVESWLQMSTLSGDRIARRAGIEQGCLPVYSMQDKLDLDDLLRQELRAQKREFLIPMDKAKIEYDFLVEWLDRVGGNKFAESCTTNDKKNIFIRILQLLRNLL